LHVFGVNSSRIEAYSVRFEVLRFALLKIYVLCYVTPLAFFIDVILPAALWS
jgi:hypothetical protein